MVYACIPLHRYSWSNIPSSRSGGSKWVGLAILFEMVLVYGLKSLGSYMQHKLKKKGTNKYFMGL